MPATDENDELSGSRQVVLILRLVLDRQARLRHGELLDADAVGEGRFVTTAGLQAVVQRWLERQEAERTRADGTPVRPSTRQARSGDDGV